MISIIIPVYNEAESLHELFFLIKENLNKINKNFEIIFINDGSIDNSLNILNDIKEKSSYVKVINFLINKGKATALMQGFKIANGNIIITMDADLQDRPEELPRFINMIEKEDYDLVSGFKQNRQDSFIKVASSRFFNYVVRKFSNINLHDFNCGYKAYKKDIIKKINIYGELHRFIPVLLSNENIKIGELKIIHEKRKLGKTKYGITRFFKGYFDFLTVILITKYSKRPLHFFGSIGLLLSFIGFILLSILSFYRFIYGNFGGKTPALLLGILLLILGVQFLCTGLLGEIIIYYSERK